MNPYPDTAKRIPTVVKLAIVLVILSGLLLACLLMSSTPQYEFTWLTTSELYRDRHINPLTRLKLQAMRLAFSLRHRFGKNQSMVIIDARVFDLATATNFPVNPSPPIATGPHGTRSWVLSPEQMRNTRAQFDDLPESALVGKPRLVPVDRGASGAGSNAVPMGLVLYLIPDAPLTGGRIALTIGLNHTVFETNAVVVRIKTNQAYAFRVVFPNDGGLVLEDPAPEPNTTNRFWLLLSIRAVDAKGRLLGR